MKLRLWRVGREMSEISSSARDFLLEQSVLTLSIVDNVSCWAAPVLYAVEFSTGAFSLYFLSSDSSRHIQALAYDDQVAASIYADYQGRWQSICGMQMKGQVSVVETAHQEYGHEAYFSRFPEIKELIDHPTNEQEQRIGAAFAKSHLYRFSPNFVRFINNSDRFAGRTEWQI